MNNTEKIKACADNAENSAEAPRGFFVRLKKRFCSLSTSSRIQLVAAVIITVAAIISAPTLAWFAKQKEMSVSAKINSPATLEIKSGGPKDNEQDIINFELSNIDTEDKSYKSYIDSSTGDKYYYKDYVFCIKGQAISSYDLQFAHTTNIPFKYEIYRAVQDDTLLDNDPRMILYESKDKSVTQKYKLARVKVVDGTVQTNNEGGVIYEDYSTPIDGAYVNKDTGERILANNSLQSRSYSGGDSIQSYAQPLYWLKRNITVYPQESSQAGFTHSYVLRVSWQMPDSEGEGYDRENINAVQNNKETDMIYITAAVS